MITAALSALVFASCGTGADEDEQVPEHLWDRTFISMAVTEDGQPRALVDDTRIRLTFEERQDRGVARWRAGCNTYGGSAEISADRILLGQIAGTQMGCPDELHEQDDWLVGFFAADPRWRLSDERLTLTSGETVIELEARG